MNLQEIRAKYPQYDDLPDEQLVRGLHQKHYADMPFEDFAGRIGYSPAPSGPGLVDQITGALTGAAMSLPTPTDAMRAAYDAATGLFGDIDEGVSVTQRNPQAPSPFPRLTESSPVPAGFAGEPEPFTLGMRRDPMQDNPILREVLARPTKTQPSGAITPAGGEYLEGSIAQQIADYMRRAVDRDATREEVVGPDHGLMRTAKDVAGGAAGFLGGTLDALSQASASTPGPVADALQDSRRLLLPNDPGIYDEVISSVGTGIIPLMAGLGAPAAFGRLATASPSLANWVSASVFGATEAAPESASVYRELLDAGVDPETARAASSSKFLADLGANIGLNRAGLFSGKGRLGSLLREMGTEVPEELWQQGTGNLAAGRDVTEGMGHSALVAALATPLLAGPGAVMARPEGKAAQKELAKQWAKSIEMSDIPVNAQDVLEMFRVKQPGEDKTELGPTVPEVKQQEQEAKDLADLVAAFRSRRSGAQPLDEREAFEFEQQVARERVAPAEATQKAAQVDQAYADRQAAAEREREMDAIMAEWEKADQEQAQAELLQRLRDKASEMGGPMQAAWERVIDDAILEREGRVRSAVKSQERERAFTQAERDAQAQRQQEEEQAYQQGGQSRIQGALTRAETERNITGTQPNAMEDAFRRTLLGEPSRLISNEEREGIREGGGLVGDDYAFRKTGGGDIWSDGGSPERRAYEQLREVSNVLPYAGDPLRMAVAQAGRGAQEITDMPEVTGNMSEAIAWARPYVDGRNLRSQTGLHSAQKIGDEWVVLDNRGRDVASFGRDELAAKTFLRLAELEIKRPTQPKTPNLDAMRKDMGQRKPWMVSRQEYVAAGAPEESSIRGEQHRIEVRRALNRGEQVPASALEAYPDLQEKAPGGLLKEGVQAGKTPSFDSGVARIPQAHPFKPVDLTADIYQYKPSFAGPLFQIGGPEIPISQWPGAMVTMVRERSEAAVLTDALNQLKANGMPVDAYLAEINSIGALRGKTQNTLGMHTSVQEAGGGKSVVGLSERLLRDVASTLSKVASLQVSFTIAHELGHVLDKGYSENSPLFAINVDGPRLEVGPVLASMRAGAMQDDGLFRELQYPFHSFIYLRDAVVARKQGKKFVVDPDTGKTTDISEFIDKTIKLIKTEAFAQLHGLFYTVGASKKGREYLRQAMPEAIRFMEEVHDAVVSGDGVAGERVLSAFQYRGAGAGDALNAYRRADEQDARGVEDREAGRLGYRDSTGGSQQSAWGAESLVGDIQEKRDAGHRREKSTGRYVGAPDWVGNSPQRLAALRKKLRQLALEGESGRYWYERSSRAVLEFVGGDKADAEKFVGLLAIYSQSTEVNINLGFALEAFYQWKMGLPIQTGRFPTEQNKKAEKWLRKGKDWGGIKTNNFYADLMEEIDASKVDYQHATMDMWMALAFDYGAKVLDQGPKYNFAKREIALLAEELGWKPHQVQAAIWTAIKARVESTEKLREKTEKRRGINPKDTKSKGTPDDWGRGAYAHYRLAHKLGMELNITKERIAELGFDFADGLQIRMAQMSWEAEPGDTTPDIPGIRSATTEQKFEYLRAVSDVLFKDGVDQIAKLIGLHTPPTIFGYSAWEGAVGAGAQSFFPVPITGETAKRAVRPSGKQAMNLYAAIKGLVLRQKAVTWHIPIYDEAAVRKNGVDIRTARPLTETETRQLYDALHAEFGTWEIAPGYTRSGARVLNFVEGLDNKRFQAGMGRVLKSLPEEFGGTILDALSFRSDGDYISNDWSKHPDGQEYRDQIGATGRPDLQRGIERLRADVETVNRDFAERYGWDEAGGSGSGAVDSALFLGEPRRHAAAGRDDAGAGRAESGQAGRGTAAGERGDRAVRSGASRAQAGAPPVRADGRIELTHWSKVGNLTELDPSYHGTGIAGAESRREGGPDWVDRTYFGINPGGPGGYQKESGLGPHRYTVAIPADRLYDYSKDPDGFFEQAFKWTPVRMDGTPFPDSRKVYDHTKIERLIKEAGYAGMWVADPRLGMTAIVFEKTQPESYVNETQPARTAGTLYANPIQPVAEALERLADTGIDAWNRAVGWRYKELGRLPSQELYLTKRYRALGRIANVEEIAKKVYSTFRDASPTDQVAIYQYLTTQGADPATIQEESVRKRAIATKKLFINVGQQLVDRGLLPQDVFDANKGSYLPRLYLRHLLPDDMRYGLGSGNKVSNQGYLKKRLNDEQLPPEVREIILGEITDPAYLAAQGLTMEMRDIAILDLLEQISQNDDWVWRDTVIDWQGRPVSIFWLQNEADQIERQAAHYQDAPRQKALALVDQMRATIQPRLDQLHKAPADYRQVPNSPRYGRLRGMYLRKEIYDDLVGSGQMQPPDADMWQKLFGYGGTGTKITQLWKMSKVALNPPAQIRNVMSNMVLLHLSGIPLARVPEFVTKAIYHRANNGKYWRIAKKLGVTESTFASNELMRIHRDLLDLQARMQGPVSIATLKNIASIIGQGAGDAYQFFEQVGKTARIMYAMQVEGKTEDEAGQIAQRWLFDYSLVPNAVRTMRNMPVGMPFVTFYYKVLPRIMEAAIKNPLAFAPYFALPYLFASLFASMNDVDDDDMEKLQKAMPTWIREKGHALLLPYRDEYGRWQVFDFSYLLPWTMFTESVKNVREGKVGDLLDDSGLFGGPITSLITVFTDNEHKDPWSGKPVFNENDPASKQVTDFLTYLYTLSMPTWLTEAGFAGKMMEAIDGEVDPKTGRHPATVSQAALRLVGMNVYPFEPGKDRERNLMQYGFEMQDMRRAQRAAMRDARTDEEREAIRKQYEPLFEEKRKEREDYERESRLPERLR